MAQRPMAGCGDTASLAGRGRAGQARRCPEPASTSVSVLRTALQVPRLQMVWGQRVKPSVYGARQVPRLSLLMWRHFQALLSTDRRQHLPPCSLVSGAPGHCPHAALLSVLRPLGSVSAAGGAQGGAAFFPGSLPLVEPLLPWAAASGPGPASPQGGRGHPSPQCC